MANDIRYTKHCIRKFPKGDETPPPPVAEKGGVKESSERKQRERQRSNATIEFADNRKALWSLP